MLFHDLVKKVLRAHKDTPLDYLERVYHFASQTYEGKAHETGISYIDHALHTALHLVDFRLSVETLAAALLSRALECGVKLDFIKKEFGPEVAFLVEGVSSVEKLKTKTEEQDNTNLRKMFLAAAQDIRILFIRLCDQLYLLETVKHISDPERRKQIGQEVLDIYSPIAYRLGLGQLKSQLEDLAFEHVYPEQYHVIVTTLKASQEERLYILHEMRKIIHRALEKESIPAEVQARVKHLYSIYHKIVERNYKLEDMRDLIALRIIVENIDQCYSVLRLIHSLWTPIPETFKDYIANPKENGYQSLHTSVIGVKEKPVEFQVRTREMHAIAEEGVAVHWGYKGVKHGGEVDTKLQWLKQLLEFKNLSAQEFVEHVKLDLFSDKIYVLTPKGKVIELPKGALPLDFAYAIHSDLGDHCMGVSINGKYSSLKTSLENGNTVEIITAKQQHPAKDWVKLVRTSKARTKIKQFLRRAGVTLSSSTNISFQKKEKQTIEEGLIDTFGIKDLQINFAHCCGPLPGDKILGFRKLQQLNIHRADCLLLKNLTSQKPMKIAWKAYSNMMIELILATQDRLGLLAEVLNVVASQGINIEDAKGKVLSRGQAEIRIKAQIPENAILLHLITILKKIKNVQKVYLGEIYQR